MMNGRKITLCALWLLVGVCAQASEMSQKLQTSEHVLLMRHTLAPGVGDPAGYTLNDCKTQRNLSAQGRKQASVVGAWLKKQGVTAAEVYTSAWCRCQDTAKLLDFGSVQVEPALASFFDEMHQAKERTTSLKQLIADKLKTKGDKALILVTHHVNIQDYAGENIASGDMVLARVGADGQLLSYKLIPRPD
jgi:phosphohistidine phosphatase SixA